MPIRLQRKLETIEDLIDIEACLRAMYNTVAGTACQALLTMEYVCWRNRVIGLLRKGGGIPSQAPHPDSGQLPDSQHGGGGGESLEAFLCGFRIVYARHTCVIHQLLPSFCDGRDGRDGRAGTQQLLTGTQKRVHTATTEQPPKHRVDTRQEESYHVFKKHRLCLSPPRA